MRYRRGDLSSIHDHWARFAFSRLGITRRSTPFLSLHDLAEHSDTGDTGYE